MRRRSFVKASVMAGAAATLGKTVAAKASRIKSGEQQYYELRVYTLKDDHQQKLVENFYESAAIPALNKLGIKNVGVFTELKPAGQTRIYVIIPYKSIAQVAQIGEQLSKDAAFQQAGTTYLNAPSDSPAYERIESSLMKAFAHMPMISVPEAKARFFELRQYQSASEAAGKKKIEMFNDKGEIDIFKRLGFRPVFFGETVIGPLRPNLTYMITFDDMDAHGRLWKSFGGDPEWKKISSVPEYADKLLVSKITSTFITPTAFSQV
ncbi:NIPSNAP family protein [Mucilaginibacter sp. RS28]|uniref:NIPSNAP family protein n=1 Tax=Mucilaginibacter straminoryzae TaxID=2932774 RepID=A0A9X1X375_9SPHI|nr:NIPSNAP family protein [Mucilaginibacter straminoryzae]MCJ8210041.1 NIPSNAP family protein [Mucilaginibacter straminoryzae]